MKLTIGKLGIPQKNVASVKFGCFSCKEIRQLSVKRVSNPHSFDALNTPVPGGLYDTVFGSCNFKEVCSTCNQLSCCGHLGHIELPLPVFNPIFFKQVVRLLQSSCHNCNQFFARKDKVLLFAAQLEALSKGNLEILPALRQARNLLYDHEDFQEDIPRLADLKNQFEKMICKLDTSTSYHDNKKELWTRQCVDMFTSICSELALLTKDKKQTICPHCKHKRVIVCGEHLNRIYFKQNTSSAAKRQYVTPSHVRILLKGLWQKEKAFLSNMFKGIIETSHDEAINALFLEILPIPSVKFRPARPVNGIMQEDSQSLAYSKVVMDCRVISLLLEHLKNTGDDKATSSDVTFMNMNVFDSVPGELVSEKIENAWQRLQQHVNAIVDSDSQKFTNKEVGIRQLLEKKEGLFRKYVMGKRVNFAARSVISPDPYIATNEIGIPQTFAVKLTYPTPVTPRNIKQLRQAVINGPLKYPGATHVLINGETKVMISRDDPEKRLAVAKQLIATEESSSDNKLQKPTVVMRYLQTGDVLLINRQPTLHRGSIMAHKAYVLPGEKTLRLHYANCKSYNADFDGDEMNAHFPQSELGRAEAMTLMLTDKQYLSAKDGKPLSCLIQDHIVAGVHMSTRGSYFRRNEYRTLVFNALGQFPGRIKVLPPSLLKPEELWSGKQVLSTLLINIIPSSKPLINLQGKSKISAKEWRNGPGRRPVVAPIRPGEMCESQVIVRQAELLCGILDKAHYGATEFGLVHSIFEIYGGDISGKLLTCFARLFTAYLQRYKGFTLGVEDIETTNAGDHKRKKIIASSKDERLDVVAKSLGIKSGVEASNDGLKLEVAHTAMSLNSDGGKAAMAQIDHSMKQLSNSINNQISSSCSGNGLLKAFPHNNLQLMVTSGAKGGMVNSLQISCSLGQIELEGQRPSLSYAGRSCPSFKPFDTSLRSGGFVTQRFLTGLRSQEYFFHCMAGREGLVDTAVKTSNSGYLQRCLVKSLESLMLSYDLTVRDNGGGVVQFLYGDDGIDVGKSACLKEKQFDFLLDNSQVISKQLTFIEKSGILNMEKPQKKWKKYVKAKKKVRRLLRHENCEKRASGFLRFANMVEYEDKHQLVKAWQELGQDERKSHEKKAKRANLPDPVIAQLRPDTFLGSTSELYKRTVEQYLCGKGARYFLNGKVDVKRVEKMFDYHYQRSLCEPGDDVGLLAAQSVGEPSTQMTLNTFHFAGRGEMNVTLGIPRLREILMSNVKIPRTPHITVPVQPEYMHQVKRLCKKLATVLLSKVLHKFEVKEAVHGFGEARRRRCAVTMTILPDAQLKEIGTSRKLVMHHIEKKFVKKLVTELAGQVKKVKIEDYVYDETEAGGEAGNQKDNDEDEHPTEVDEGNEVPEDNDDGGSDEEEGEVEYEDDGSESEKSSGSEETGDNTEGSDKEDDDSRAFALRQLKVNDVYVEDFAVSKSKRRCTLVVAMPLMSFNADVASLVRHCANQSCIQKTADVTRCMLVSEQHDDVTKFVMEGFNFFKLFENQECFDLSKLYSNSVHSIANIYGIEAARSVIIQEVIKVFGVYGIEIDRRHLSLLADFMCVDGVPKGCNRHAIQSCSSPLQQMTFETSCNFITRAALHGFTDYLTSPSSNVVAGKIVKAGTGSFSLLYPLTSSPS